MSATTFVLGQRVRIAGTAAKVKTWDPPRTTFKPGPLPATTSDYRPDPEHEPDRWARRRVEIDTGIIVGRRTIADYAIDYGGYDEPTVASAVPGTHRRVWLVAFALDRKPVMVLPEQIAEVLS